MGWGFWGWRPLLWGRRQSRLLSSQGLGSPAVPVVMISEECPSGWRDCDRDTWESFLWTLKAPRAQGLRWEGPRAWCWAHRFGGPGPRGLAEVSSEGRGAAPMSYRGGMLACLHPGPGRRLLDSSLPRHCPPSPGLSVRSSTARWAQEGRPDRVGAAGRQRCDPAPLCVQLLRALGGLRCAPAQGGSRHLLPVCPAAGRGGERVSQHTRQVLYRVCVSPRALRVC